MKWAWMFIIVMLAGCTTPPAKPEVVYTTVYKTSYVKVPTKCVLKEPVVCDFSGLGGEPCLKLLACVKLQKEALKSCTGQ